MSSYKTISEIVAVKTGEPHPPLNEWQIDVVERDISKDLGDLGGRKSFVANARVRVTEADGSSWEGLAIIEE